MKTASCPSCGAPVVFKSAASIYAVCEFCRSTLLRDGETLKDLGRMAELMDDPSLIRIGSEGRYKGIHFGVIGRIQLKYEQGLWNEWHILFDDGRNAWLSEAGGEYVVSAQRPSAANLPAFASLKPDMPVLIDGQRFAVTNLTTARCIAGQGELPFKVESGYDVNTADLRDGQKFATIDYSETPPLLFVGSPAKFDELNLTNLNEAPGDSSSSPGGARVKAEAFNCPSCAAPLTIHSLAIQRIGCPGCGSMIGVENAKVRLLAEAAQKLRIQPWLPLGSKGRLANIDWEAIGFMERYSTSEGVNYFWREYLLFNAKEGFAWLTEYDGHWNFVRTLSDPPWSGKRKLRFVYGEESFRHFSSSRAKVSYVIGEFYWRVKVRKLRRRRLHLSSENPLAGNQRDRSQLVGRQLSGAGGRAHCFRHRRSGAEAGRRVCQPAESAGGRAQEDFSPVLDHAVAGDLDADRFCAHVSGVLRASPAIYPVRKYRECRDCRDCWGCRAGCE